MIAEQERRTLHYQSEEIDSLANAILRHRQLYYGGKPEISDQDFDQLEERLRQIAPKHPVLLSVGAPVASERKVAHAVPMLSLNKTYLEEDLLAWAKDRPVIGMLKVDGNCLSIIYQNGEMILAKTRGNGRVGEDVTEKIRWVTSVLPKIPDQRKVEIRGELFCTEENFIELAHEMADRGLERPSAPRNIVAGILGRKTEIDLARRFSFFAFDILIDDDSPTDLATEEKKFSLLADWGFRLPDPSLLTTPGDIEEYLQYVKSVMEKGSIGCDGAVFSYNDLHLHRELGSTAHHPRFKLSFKWQGATAVSAIKKIVWATSRHGIVTPVAVVNPVNLSGASITNITLHNAAMVQTYNLKPGDQIELVRSGEVIPKFLRVVEQAPGDFCWPEVCHSCGEKLVFDDVRLRCQNQAFCPAQQSGTILNWIRVAGIDDISDKRLEAMQELGLVRTIPDLYRLELNDLLQLPLTKDRMARKLIANIDGSRRIPLARFLQGLGIPGAGITSWEKILEMHPSLDEVQALSVDDLVKVDGFAEKSAEQIVNGLKKRQSLIAELLEVGVTPVKEQPLLSPKAGRVLTGMQFVITGALSRPRSEIEQLIKAAGGKTTGSVSARTKAVITNEPESNSSKMRKASELGIPIWSEEDLDRELAAD